MNPAGQRYLGLLTQADWFQHTGQDLQGAAAPVEGWEEALHLREDAAWENLLLRQQDELFHALGRPASWNDLVRELNSLIADLMSQKSQALSVTRLSKTLQQEVEWDLLHALIEAQSGLKTPPGFYSRLGDWYLRGRFPCGWRGEYPIGQLVVF